MRLIVVLVALALALAVAAADSVVEGLPKLERTVERRGKSTEASAKRRFENVAESCGVASGANPKGRARVIVPELGCVTVTGATGFVAGHVIEVLLNKGYTVHGTVRTSTLGNESKTAHLRKLEKRGLGTLRLFGADLTGGTDAFKEAAKGCSSMIHLASVVTAANIQKKFPTQEERNKFQVEASVAGTVAALEAAKAAGMRKVVVTSSVASISPTKAKMGRKLGDKDCQRYTETDLNDVSTMHEGTYSFSKTRALLATESFWGDKDAGLFDLATIHFPWAFGPQQTTRVTSSNLILWIMAGANPKSPPGFFIPWYTHVVDVRDLPLPHANQSYSDVARAHVHVLEDARGKGRYVVALPPEKSSQSSWDIRASTLSAFARLGAPNSIIRRVPFIIPPAWVIQLVAWSGLVPLVDQQAADLAFRGRSCGYDGTKITRELGFQYYYEEIDEIVWATIKSFFEVGIIDREAAALDDSRQHSPERIALLVGGSAFAALAFIVALRLCCAPAAVAEKEKSE